MDDDATKPESSKSVLKRKREEEAVRLFMRPTSCRLNHILQFEIVVSAKEISIKKHTSSKARRTVIKTVDITVSKYLQPP